MTESVWQGGTFIKYEGGYEIILKALEHYKRRLATLNQSPELQNSAGMFASVLNQEAQKTVPEISDTIKKIHGALGGQISPQSLQEDVPLLGKALSCYRSDIQKACDTGDEYFLKLVGEPDIAKNDMGMIDVARRRLEHNS